MKARKGYTKGMNRDITSDKQDPGSYYNLENFRMVTEDGHTTGSLTNESSNTVKFTIPDLQEMTLANGITIPAQPDLKIIGWTTIIDAIIVFTTNNEDENPIGYGQIWSCKFNEALGTIEGLDAGALDPDVHLLYNQALNFSTYHRIGRAIGRYENSNIARVYWTDNNNPVSAFNTFAEDPLNVPLNTLPLAAYVSMAQPVITGLGVGSLRTTAMIQFAYRLKTIGGATTIFSPSSTLYPLPAAAANGVTWAEWAVGMYNDPGGADVENKSVTYDIIGIDTTWDVIEHFAILYSERDVFTVYSFREENIPDSGNLIGIECSSLSDAIPLTTVEFNILSSGFDVAKDIEVKGNRLIAANTKTTSFVINFDARAYRFNNTQSSLLRDEDAGDIVLNGDTPDYVAVPLTHNAINPYNDESELDWDTLNQYAYQSNGNTMGGSGVNVSYEFTTVGTFANFFGSETVTSAPSHFDMGSLSENSEPTTTGVLDANGDLVEFTKAGQLQNMAGPHLTSIFTGYTRGEVYRYGIVFYNASGSTSYVNWIGDIRFPEPLDGDEYAVATGGGAGIKMNSMGIKFTVDTSSIQDQITGYSIVRVVREEQDRSRLGTGMLMWFEKYVFNNESIIHEWEVANADGGPGEDNPWPMESTVTVGAIDEDGFHLPTNPGYHPTQADFQSVRDVAFLLSPHGKNIQYDFKEEDYLKTYGYYGARATQYGTQADSGPDSDKSYAFYYKTNIFFPAGLSHPTERIQIDKSVRLRTGEFLYSSNAYLDGRESIGSLRNTSASRDSYGVGGGGTDDVPLGIGNPKIAVMLKNDPTINNAISHRTEMGYINDDFYQNSVFLEDSDVAWYDSYFKEVALCRHIINQYGGDTNEARSNNQYISTGHYQIINENIGTSLTFKVFGGDTYVNYLDDEYCEQYFSPSSVFGEVYETDTVNKLSVVACYPTEGIVNQDFTRGKKWFAYRDADDMGLHGPDSFTYAPVWSQEDTAKDIYFAENFLSNTVEEHPHQLWASQPKIDGEFSDSWRSFLVNNSIEVTGVYGPINRIIAHNEKIYYYQNSAVGVTTVDERVVINDVSGQALTLGTGGIFPDYRYISLLTGSTHQFSVVSTQSSIYHWDSRVRKMFRTSGMQTTPLSDLKGMSSFFHKLSGQQLVDDYTLRSLSLGGPVGVHGTPDYRYNRALFTFQGILNVYNNVSELYNASNSTYEFIENTIVLQDGVSYYILFNSDYYSTSKIDIPRLSDPLSRWARVSEPSDTAFTVSYNEMFDAFEAFYSFVPSMYLQYGRRLMSTTPTTLNGAWEHNTSESRCNFYGTTYPSVLETVLGSAGGPTSSFDTLQWQGTVTDDTGNDVQESFSSIRVYNEYQDSLEIALSVGDNIKRKLRLWRTLIPRDNAPNDPRIRAPWTSVVLTYSNSNNYKHTVKDLEYSFRPSKN